MQLGKHESKSKNGQFIRHYYRGKGKGFYLALKIIWGGVKLEPSKQQMTDSFDMWDCFLMLKVIPGFKSDWKRTCRQVHLQQVSLNIPGTWRECQWITESFKNGSDRSIPAVLASACILASFHIPRATVGEPTWLPNKPKPRPCFV